MPFHDLNIAYIPDHAALSNTLSFAKELGYDSVALAIALADKVPPEPPAIPLSRITVPAGLRVLRRLTFTISDATQNHQLGLLNSAYDIVALRPTDEKTLQLCCLSLECDLISLDLSQRLPAILRFKTVASAFQRGVRFEICYSPGITGGNDARRNLISGATQLIRATRGRGLVVSSDAKSALGLRGPRDIINLTQVWGLSQQRAKEAICEEAGKVTRLAGLKRTSFRGVVDIIDGGSQNQVSSQQSQTKTLGRIVESSSKNAKITANNDSPSDDHNMPGTKRKASEISTKPPQVTSAAVGMPISKRAKKRRTKKARLDGIHASEALDEPASTPALPLTHESLASAKPV